MNQRNYLKFGILLMAFLLPMVVFGQRGKKITTVVIDPGHGGTDPGALGSFTKEKDLNLTVALLTGEYIKKNLPDVNVIYTRETDVAVPLVERAEIANRNNADVFISIHCNSIDGKSSVVGAETYVLGEHKNEQNLEVAKKENAAIMYEQNSAGQYDDFNLDSPEGYIALTLFQNAYLNQSLQLAANVQEQFTKRVGRKDRGVQQAGFHVLWKTTMPSILIELGFLSNPTEERFLASEDGQVYMASAIYRAFRDFKESFENENEIVGGADTTTAPSPTPTPDPTPKPTPEPSVTPSVKPDAKTEEPATTETPAETKAPTVSFKVQFATRDTEVPITDKAFAKVPEVGVYFYNGAYRYTSGDFRTKEEAVNRQAAVRKLGFSDAFVVAFVDGERATIKQAENALKKDL